MTDLDQIFDHLRELADDYTFPEIRKWMDQNPAGKVLGHFQVYFPEEIAHAAGMLPMKVMGAGNIECKQADARIASFVCSIVRTTLELGLSNRLDFLSAFVTHPICDAARNACGIWKRNFPNLNSQILYLPQHANSEYAPAYLRDEYRRIARILTEITGHPITDAALQSSINLFNENRRLLRDLYRVKRETPWLISATESYVLTKAGGLMPREKHNQLLRQVLELLPTRQAKKLDKIRIVFEGGFCEQPPLDMLAAIEEACYVVDDDLLIGLRWLTQDVSINGDPYANLAYAYLEQSSYSPVQHDERKQKEQMLLQRIKESSAEAAIVTAAKMCEPGLEEQVAYSHALDGAGIPHLVMEFEEKMAVFEQMRMEIETFVESLLFDFES